MAQYPIYISDSLYQTLTKLAEQENETLEQTAERLLRQKLALTNEPTSHDVEEALTAVHHLTTLFADVEPNWLEQALNDPMIELANVDLDIAFL